MIFVGVVVVWVVKHFAIEVLKKRYCFSMLQASKLAMHAIQHLTGKNISICSVYNNISVLIYIDYDDPTA